MDTYIECYKWESDNNIRFKLNTGKILNYEFKQYNDGSARYYLRNKGSELNRVLFDYLDIEDPYKWTENIVGYALISGGWPEVKSREDIKKTVEALLKYNNPKYDIKSEVLSFYNADKTEVTFKELDVTYYLYLSSGIWWCPKYTSAAREESYIFTQLKIKDKNKWVENILGYKPTGGTGGNAFPESKTKADAYKVMDALIAEYIKQFKLKTTVNYEYSKIELRRKKVDVRVGDCPAGSVVYGKRSKASVRCRRISYQTCIGS